MERNYFYRRWSMSLLFLITLTLGTSCTIYQNVPDDDGIYTTENTRREPVVVVEDSDEHREYEKNYFTKELEKIDRINGTDIITDIETYSSYNDTIPDKSMDSINEPTGRAWGYNDGDNVVININLNNNWDYGWGWGGFYDPFFNSYPWFAGPRWGWGWNRPYWGWGWGWNRPFWNPYWGFNRPFWEEDFMPIMALELETMVTVEELHTILLLTDEVLLSQDGVIPWQVEEEMSPSSGTGTLRQDANQAQPM